MKTYRITNINLPLDADIKDLKREASKKMGIHTDYLDVTIVKRSVDARKSVKFIYTIDVTVDGQEPVTVPEGVTVQENLAYELPCGTRLETRPVVVGMGPAGLFAALTLANAGARPIILERGRDVDMRACNVQAFWTSGTLDTVSNVQFGEGGAGTFSDGKLNTGIKDPCCRFVLEEFVRNGAPSDILWQAKPHIGTDKLRIMVKNMRNKIIELGGEVWFESKLSDIEMKNGAISRISVETKNGICEIQTDCVILSIGHSARDTVTMLFERGIEMAQKPFAVGARIEHLRDAIDHAQYGYEAGNPAIGASEYKLAAHLRNGRGVYTFCMCPGGTVVAAASEEGMVVTNGMSEYARESVNSNSAILVGIEPADFGSTHPLAGIEFQRKIERAAFKAGGENYKAPTEVLKNFLKSQKTKQFGRITPSYLPGTEFALLDDCMPKFVTDSIREGIRIMSSKLRGFDDPDAVLTGVETRSSSPVRIVRGDDYQSINCRGLYPCGEGSGYAGGIMSAAVDGIHAASEVFRFTK